ncbi:MAG: SpoIVB peptidase [Bacteroides sp.]|nr:SpoIVB peptidase [Eubacterium sp.]MCM1419340.1 SpoIVB peptidase [Roseburia sp.]MCM1462020.1 SpoIVB peptidase [Bacteroides sp.]
MKNFWRALSVSALMLGFASSVALGRSQAAAQLSASAVYEEVGEREVVIPCGTPFGIKMLTDGVVVTDFGYVNGAMSQLSPAEAAGVHTGDVIVAVDGASVKDSAALSDAVQKADGECRLTVLRDGETLELTATPLRSEEDGFYKLGLWTRDSCAGIGTMTFYDPETGVFGGLGHAVSDVTTGLRLPLLEGEITAVSITDVLKGSGGSPGELCGAFVSDTETGTVKLNGECGVFGYSETTPILNDPIEIGYSGEVEKGKATILTTVAGMMPEEYEIEIVRIDRGSGSSVRNMTIRVTDERLLRRTGGIVQGMSGSPVLQNGRLVGAVTHVLVNDSTMGYAVFIENMCREATALSPVR